MTDTSKSGDPDVMKPLTSELTVNLPPFWPDKPEIWFSIAEAAFELAPKKIVSPTTKYYFVLRALNSETAAEVSDVILKPNEVDPYTQLKETLISRTSISMTQKLKQLLSGEELGDRKPSQLLRKMRQLVDKNQIADTTLREIFLQRLPSHVKAILAAQESLSLEQTAEIADKIMENISTSAPTSSSSVMASQAVKPQSTEDKLEAVLDKLTSVLAKLEVSSSTRSSPRPRRKQPRPRSRSRSRNQSQGICYYHRRFGERALKCAQPCNFKQSENDSRE